KKHAGSRFGARSLGYYFLAETPLRAEATKAANALRSLEQYQLASALYEKLDADNRLDLVSLLNYGSAISEVRPDIKGADAGIAVMQRALDLIAPRLAE